MSQKLAQNTRNTGQRLTDPHEFSNITAENQWLRHTGESQYPEICLFLEEYSYFLSLA